MTDPISDMLTRIRNAQAVGHTAIDIPFSKIKFSLAGILAKEGLIKGVVKKGRGIKRKIEMELIYEDERNTIPGLASLSELVNLAKENIFGQKIFALF